MKAQTVGMLYRDSGDGKGGRRGHTGSTTGWGRRGDLQVRRVQEREHLVFRSMWLSFI